MALSWTDDMSVGNAAIDSDHKILLDLVNRVMHEIKIGNHTALPQAFDLLDSGLRRHFANEEHIAQAVNYPFAQHKLAHQFLLKELDFLKEELIARDFVWCAAAVKHYSHSLKELTIDHITKKDMRMKPVLESHPYNFNPA